MGKNKRGMRLNAYEARKQGISVAAYIAHKHQMKATRKATTPAMSARMNNEALQIRLGRVVR
ncbi:TPA_asm: hypothetical protein vir530_00014 [dsDNA virus vir530]|nr:TPA_asm: hypothetical protein vir530_00014 [dsDNA virus vir530]